MTHGAALRMFNRGYRTRVPSLSLALRLETRDANFSTSTVASMLSYISVSVAMECIKSWMGMRRVSRRGAA